MADHETSVEALDDRVVETRSELARCIPPSTFPAHAPELVAALPLDADDWVRAALAALPEDQQFENVEQVWEALGGERF